MDALRWERLCIQNFTFTKVIDRRTVLKITIYFLVSFAPFNS